MSIMTTITIMTMTTMATGITAMSTMTTTGTDIMGITMDRATAMRRRISGWLSPSEHS